MVAPSNPVHTALNLLALWRAVRPSTVLGGVQATVLEQAGLAERCGVALGEATVLSQAGKRLLGLSRGSPSDTVIMNALYRQDAQGDLEAAGYWGLHPGRGRYGMVTHTSGVVCPVLGRMTGQGYHRKRIREVISGMRTDLIVAQSQLVVIMPVPVTWADPQVRVVLSAPRCRVKEVERDELGLPGVA